jgi:hypothetical protein
MKKPWIVLLLISFPVFALTQNRYDIVIDEIMADPTPAIGLPNNEWVELRNTTSSPVNLQGWRIGDATGQSGPMPNFILQPDSFVIVCTGGAAAAMLSFGATVAVSSFPSLDNDGDQLFLRAANGGTIHAVVYSVSWYQNQLKKDGGWSLEMIDVKNPCTGSGNWKASTNTQGGTPGKKNSIDASNTDQTGPKLKYTYTIDSMTVVAVFDEPVDSLRGATPANYILDGGISVTAATSLPPLFNMVQLKMNDPLTANKVYRLVVSKVTDCKDNLIGNLNNAKVGLPVEAAAGEIVINEILFKPKINSSDYVEFYNLSNKIFDASKLYAANRNSNRIVSSIKQIFPTPFYVFPGDYLVITEDVAGLQRNYLVQNPGAVVALSSLPSYPDDEGDVILLNGQGTIVDEVNYKDDWQFKLIDNDEGVALERIDPAGPSQDASNWHSAASTSGYGTPSYVNSQFKQIQNIDATVMIVPKIFSPDNDGHDDIVTIEYKAADLGYVANVTIFNDQGRSVRYLVQNGTLGLTGYWNWDGLDEKSNKLPIGIYIVYTEIFNLQGKKQHFKNTVVLARTLN